MATLHRCLVDPDATLDLGFDAQYQWISDMHAITLKGAYVWQNRKNTVEMSPLNATASAERSSPG